MLCYSNSWWELINKMEDTGCYDNDLIVIGQEEFKKRWNMLQSLPVKVSYLQRAEQLGNDYVCFKFKPPQHNTKQHGKNNRTDPVTKISAIQDFPSTKNMRPRVGILFTNTEGKARKNFVAFMNKLSPQNKDSILQNFIKSLDADNINIYMDQLIKLFQLQPTYHNLYMEVMHLVITISPEKAKQFMNDHFKEFIEQNGYKIPVNILECMEHIAPQGENTDNLCEYTKWKKQMKAQIVLYIHMLANHMFGTKQDIETLFTVLANTCNENWNDASAIDVYLDITLHAIQAIYKYIPKGIDIFPTLAASYRKWTTVKDILKPASKFKVIDILEIMNKNQKNVIKEQKMNVNKR